MREKEAFSEDILDAAEAACDLCGITPHSDLRIFARQVAGIAISIERQRIIAMLKDEADLTPCAEDAIVTRSNARLIEANFSYEEAERLAEKEGE